MVYARRRERRDGVGVARIAIVDYCVVVCVNVGVGGVGEVLVFCVVVGCGVNVGVEVGIEIMVKNASREGVGFVGEKGRF